MTLSLYYLRSVIKNKKIESVFKVNSLNRLADSERRETFEEPIQDYFPFTEVSKLNNVLFLYFC